LTISGALWYKSAVPWLLGCMCFVPFVQFYVFPRASPSGIHKTALRVQITYTLESHGTTIYLTHFPGQTTNWISLKAQPGNLAIESY